MGWEERGQWAQVSLLTRTLILSDQHSILMTSFNLNHFLTPNTVTLSVRASAYDLGEMHTFSPVYKYECKLLQLWEIIWQ